MDAVHGILGTLAPVRERHHEDSSITLHYLPVWQDCRRPWLIATPKARHAAVTAAGAVGHWTETNYPEPLDRWLQWMAAENNLSYDELALFVANLVDTYPYGNMARWVWFLA